MRDWYAAWEKVKGYGSRNETQKQLLLRAKSLMISHMLRRAKENNWTHGVAVDPTVSRADLRRVLHIDTPRAQVSYHLGEREHRDLPEYLTPWTGRHESGQITLALLEDERIAECTSYRRTNKLAA